MKFVLIKTIADSIALDNAGEKLLQFSFAENSLTTVYVFDRIYMYVAIAKCESGFRCVRNRDGSTGNEKPAQGEEKKTNLLFDRVRCLPASNY